MSNCRGTLLLEVLVAAVILSVGILSCLNIFSAAIHASSQTFQGAIARSYLDQALFPYFLDPTSLDFTDGDHALTYDGKSPLRPHLRIESINPVKNESADEPKTKQKENSGQSQPPKLVVAQLPSAEFFKTDFMADHKNGKTKYEFNEILFQFGQNKKSKDEKKSQ